MRVSKRKVLGIFGLSLLPLQTSLGMILGYFLSKFLAGKKAGEQGIIKSIIISFKNWKIHLHHWFLSSIFLSLSFFDFFHFPQFLVGFLGGALIQGLSYPDWHRILIKERSNENFRNRFGRI
jgi:hypothetical protein